MGLELATMDRAIARQARQHARAQRHLEEKAARLEKLARECYLRALDVMHLAPFVEGERAVAVVARFREILERAEAGRVADKAIHGKGE